MPKPRPKKKAAKKKGPAKKPQRPGAKGARSPARPAAAPGKRRPRRVPERLAPVDAGERLQKLLAAAGVASRRECELLIAEGRVQVDGVVVTELGVRVDPFKQQVHFDGEPLPKRRRVHYAVNKPDGYVSTARDPSGRPRVIDLLPPDVGRVFNVGRLDMASEGLILLTNDGELANRLTHPRHGVEKLYHVQVAGQPTPEALREVRGGVYLKEGKVSFANVRIKSRRKNSTILEVTLDEGRNREIRRVLARVGHKVQKLTRVAVGPVRLGDLPSGAYRPLTREEVHALRTESAAAADSDPPARGSRPTDRQAQTGEGRPRRTPKRGKRTPGTSAPQAVTKKSVTKKSGARRIIGADTDTSSNQRGDGSRVKRAKKARPGAAKGTRDGRPAKKKVAKKKPSAGKRGNRRR